MTTRCDFVDPTGDHGGFVCVSSTFFCLFVLGILFFLNPGATDCILSTFLADISSWYLIDIICNPFLTKYTMRAREHIIIADL